ncbi:hypothetical protein GRI58_15145 [Porphyrobacter algicida]|uniref:Uncharacterized protein n=1 Tax=Qipengyuania algicida TaxID=1836209 RepID=A0A845AKK3_9SPHN|nr:hypothetical protein [Qipengyuania algicida]
MLLIALAVASAQAPLPLEWASFGRTASNSHVSETVEIATSRNTGADQFQYELRYTKKSRGGEIETKWADSLECPSVRSVIYSMRNIQMPRPAPFGAPGEPMGVSLDGTRYFLIAPSTYEMGKITITSNEPSPLSKWVDSALQQLKACWKIVRDQ